MLRLRAFIPLLIVIVVLVGVSALARGSEVLGIAILALEAVALPLGHQAARRAMLAAPLHERENRREPHRPGARLNALLGERGAIPKCADTCSAASRQE